MNLPDEKREAVAEVVARALDVEDMTAPVPLEDHIADALAPLLAEWLAEARVPAVFLADDHEECDRAERHAYQRGLAEGEARLRVRVEAFDVSRWMARHVDIFEVWPHENRYCLTDTDVDRLQSDLRAALAADAEES